MKKTILALLCLSLFIPCYARTITINADRSDEYLYLDEPSEATDGRKGNESILENPGYAPNVIIVKFRQSAADSLYLQFQQGAAADGLQFSDSLQKLNNKYKLKKASALFKNFRKNQEKLKALQQQDKILLTPKQKHILRRLKRAPKDAKVPDLDRIYKLEFDLGTGQSLEELVAAYNNDPDVEYAALNYFVSGCKIPNDSLYSIQWPLNNIGQVYPESGKYNTPPGTPNADIDAPEAWEITTGSDEVIVAVIDTGVDYTHRDISANMWVNSGEIPGNGLDDDDNGYIDDIYGYDFYNDDNDPLDDDGHGTHCAGIIAAAGNNGFDIAGVCWNAKIMAVKFLGVDTVGSVSDAVEALHYAVENGADVVSNSWGERVGCGGIPQALKDVINYAYSQGVIAVAGAGNGYSEERYYPACLEHVIAVAATNSNDEKAPFSTYGSWVEIAAPGVDILSLLAGGTTKGTPYDEYTTIMSGTSMACPHISGACALMLSVYPSLEIDEVNDILIRTADPIAPEICVSGRLNLSKALQAIASFAAGIIKFDRDLYSCSDTVQITVRDLNLKGNGIQEVTITSNSSDLETVDLMETSPSSGVFTGTIFTDSGSPDIGDDILQVSHSEVITATYYDANDGTGNPATVTDTATIDCQAPIVTNVLFDEHPQGPQLTITFETDEPTTARVLCGLVCGGPYTAKSNNIMATSHVIVLDDYIIQPDTINYFVIEVNDIIGHSATDDNYGTCYAFAAAGPRDINVPDEYTTIQEAIDNAWEGSTIWVADGIYTGDGNKNIDFKGKLLTVRNENGPEACIIDCENDGRGFWFHSGEDANSILDGLTITNGYAQTLNNGYKGAGGILCEYSNPMIRNCIIIGNESPGCGGGISSYESTAKLVNCTFINNSSDKWGGGMINYHGGVTLINCVFKNNSARSSGGGFCGYGSSTHPKLKNCLFSGNTAGYGGGGISSQNGSNSIVTNCTFTNNSASKGGGLFLSHGGATMTNCILWNNQASSGKQVCFDNKYCRLTVNYTNLQEGLSDIPQRGGTLTWGPGNIDADPCFVDPDNRNYHLGADSPCINAGDPCHPYDPNETDLDGKRRIIASRIDMGAYEFGNIPVAVAGPNQTAYAWIDGIADVNLDGSGSYDNDGDSLTYLWSWEIEPNIYGTNGVNPIIELPVGEHIIELVVNDGLDDSEPNCTTVTVIEPLRSFLRIMPRTINRRSRQRHIIAWLSLPAEVTGDDIDKNVPLTLYPGDIEASRQFIFESDRYGNTHAFILAFFNKRDLMNAVPEDGPVQLEVVGQLNTGRYFFGQRTVRIINPPHRRGRSPSRH